VVRQQVLPRIGWRNWAGREEACHHCCPLLDELAVSVISWVLLRRLVCIENLVACRPDICCIRESPVFRCIPVIFCVCFVPFVSSHGHKILNLSVSVHPCSSSSALYFLPQRADPYGPCIDFREEREGEMPFVWPTHDQPGHRDARTVSA
jgi:hypothetical protein